MNFNILLAEDDEDIVKLLKLYLENEGYVVLWAKDGVEASEIFDKEKVDLALVDIMMPRMNGYELTKYIRKKSNIPIIILSAAQLDSDKILGLNLGADDYMVKPFNPLELIVPIRHSISLAVNCRIFIISLLYILNGRPSKPSGICINTLSGTMFPASSFLLSANSCSSTKTSKNGTFISVPSFI